MNLAQHLDARRLQRKPRRTRPVASNGARRARSPRIPNGVLQTFTVAMLAVAERFAAAVRPIFEAEFKKFARYERIDAKDDQFGTMSNGKEVRFVPHPRADNPENTTVMVNAKALEKAWQKDESFYIGPGEAGIKGRREQVKAFLDEGGKLQASHVSVDENGVASFIDGRHRFAHMRDQNIDRVAITIDKSEAKSLPKEWGVEKLKVDTEADIAKKAKEVTDRARRASESTRRPSAIDPASKVASSRVEKNSKKEFARVGIDVKKEPVLGPLIDGWRKDNVARITAMQEDQLDKIESILRDGFNRRPENLWKDISRQVEGVTESRAKLIAVDQVLTLNANITRFRQVAAGIEQYQWTTSGDERVREEHEELDGQIFDWDGEGDPEEGHPGEPVNCRCTAFPLLPEDQDTDDQDSKEDDAESE